MEGERRILTYKNYFRDFINSVSDPVRRKVDYILDMLKCQERISKKFVKAIKEGIYELRVDAEGNIYRVFFIFDDGNIVVLFHGFQKKTQKTPSNEIEKALKIKKEYYVDKQQS